MIPFDSFLKLILAALLGGAIGFEREIRAKPAGLRTHILVALGSALFTIISTHPAFGDPLQITRDPARIAAQVLVGMGFIGAGVVISTRGHIRGITTAAGLWVASAVGMAVGIGEYPLAVFTTLLTVLTFFLKRVEMRLDHEHYDEN